MNIRAPRNRVWVFDLDNTLHNAYPHIFPHISAAMTRYLKEHLELDDAGANALRVQYWKRYGATLLGLIRHHGTDPHHFLWHTHQFPVLQSMIVAEPGLRQALLRLPGRKVLLSNAPRHYSQAMLRALKIEGLFEENYSVESMRFFPKPDPRAYWAMCRAHRLDPRDCIMVEDTLSNLATAKRLGMGTVWVSRSLRTPGYVDRKVSSVLELPKIGQRI